MLDREVATNLQHLLLPHSRQLISVTVELLTFHPRERILLAAVPQHDMPIQILELMMLLHLGYRGSGVCGIRETEAQINVITARMTFCAETDTATG